jgi:hypothetical protein
MVHGKVSKLAVQASPCFVTGPADLRRLVPARASAGRGRGPSSPDVSEDEWRQEGLEL